MHVYINLYVFITGCHNERKNPSLNLVLEAHILRETNLFTSSYLLRAKYKITRGSACSNGKRCVICTEEVAAGKVSSAVKVTERKILDLRTTECFN